MTPAPQRRRLRRLLPVAASIVWALAFVSPVAAQADPGPQRNGRCGATAADALGWGPPEWGDDFDSSDSLRQWDLYNGPGHVGNGVRTPDAIKVADGAVTITGDAKGNSGGMARWPGREYGRWEACARASAAAPSYHAVLVLWPDSERWPEDGEIDYMEILDPRRQTVTAAVNRFRHSDQLLKQLNFIQSVDIDATQWHSWAVEWTPAAITGYVDGVQWFQTSSINIPNGPRGLMHPTIQLDNFGGDIGAGGEMSVDWIRQYPV